MQTCLVERSKICEQPESFLLWLRYLENYNPAALVPGGEELSVLVELHAGDDISCNKVRIKYCTLPTGRRPCTVQKKTQLPYRYATRNSKLNYPQVGYRQATSTVLDDFIYRYVRKLCFPFSRIQRYRIKP